MNMIYKTEQEEFWAGEFGEEYAARSRGSDLIAGNLVLFSKIFSQANRVDSILELGANIGLNLIAIKQLFPTAELSAVEINYKAAEKLKKVKQVTVYNQSIFDFQPERKWDFVFTKGVLIHLIPDRLPLVYDLLYQASTRYICLIEYYNPTPVSVPYRGFDNKLFKRDFAGEILDRFKNVRLIDYGFRYHRDNNFPQDDATWFLLEKTK